MQATYSSLMKKKNENVTPYCCKLDSAMQARINKCAEHFKILLQKEGPK